MIWTHKYMGAGMTNEGCDFDRIVSIGVWGRNAKLDLLTSAGAPRPGRFYFCRSDISRHPSYGLISSDSLKQCLVQLLKDAGAANLLVYRAEKLSFPLWGYIFLCWCLPVSQVLTIFLAK